MSALANGPILIYGAGAVGQYLGGSLALAGRDVTLLARPALRAALAIAPLTLDAEPPGLGKGLPQTVAIPTIEAIAELSRPPTLVIVAVKGYDTPGALPDLRQLATAGATMLTVQNGIGHEEMLRDALGAGKVLSGAFTVNVSVPALGRVTRHTAKGGLGFAPVGDGSVDGLLDLFAPTLLPTVTARTHRVLKWSKMLLNILGNAQAAILDMTTAALFADSRLFAVERRAFAEARAVMRAAGIGLIDLPAYPVRALTAAMALPAPLAYRLLRRRLGAGRGDKLPSLALDLHAGRGRSEIAWYNGAIVALGAQRGVPTPVNAALTGILTAATADPAWAPYRGNPARLLAEIG